MTNSPKKNLPALILASASPRRNHLMQQFKIPFTVKPSSIDEHFDDSKAPEQIVQTLAHRKAVDVAQSQKNAVIIGADTMVVFRDTMLGKPETVEHAVSMLKMLCNNTHRVLTGIALVKTNTKGDIAAHKTFTETTRVTFGTITDDEIKDYVATGSPFDKAGAYGIQDDRGAFFVKRIEGDFYNVVGLPLHALRERLKSFAPDL